MPFNAGLWDNGVYIGGGQSPDPYGPDGPFGPSGPYVTADPRNPGFFYRDDPSVSGGIQRINGQGQVVGSYQNTAAATQGGSSFDVTRIDPKTGGPAIVNYPTEKGGLFGLGDVGGSLAGAGLIATLGLTAGLAGPALAGAAAPAAEAGAAGAEAGTAGAEIGTAGAELSTAAGATGEIGTGSLEVGGAAGGAGAYTGSGAAAAGPKLGQIASGASTASTLAKLGGGLLGGGAAAATLAGGAGGGARSEERRV